MFIKLCGFTRTEDIEKVKLLPISSVGYIFYKKSKRYVSPQQASEMSLSLKGSGILSTGVFVDEDTESIMEIVKSAHLDMVQVYDSDTAKKLSTLIPVIDCFKVGNPDQTSLPEPLPGAMVLFDTYSPEFHGGTGKSFDRNLLREYPFRDKMIVAGGVNSENIIDIIRELHPGGVDISSGIEISEGIKSEEKILKIMQLIKEAKNEINA